MSIIQGVIASMFGTGGGSPPGPVAFDGGYYGDTNQWVMNGSSVGSGGQQNTTTSAYTYPNGGSGQVLNFDGTAIMYSPNLASISNTWGDSQMTVDIWFYPTAAGVQLLSELGQADVANGWTYSMIEINSDLTISARLWNGTTAISDTKVSLNQWNHVYFTQIWTGDHYFYVNGIPKNGVSNYVREKPNGGGAEYFCIGGVNPTNMGNGNSFQGKIGYIQIHDYVATSTFDAYVNKFRPAPLALKLDANVSVTYDSQNIPAYWTDTIQNNVFTLYGSPTFSSDNGGKLHFDTGAGQYAQGTSLPSANRWTVEVWHYYDGTYTNSNPCIVTELFTGGPINYALGVTDGTGLRASFYSGGWGSPLSGYDLTPGNWYHIVGTFDGLNLYMYINGTQVQSSVWPGATPTSSGQGLRLMRRWDNDDYWGGDLSVVRIYTGALNATSIVANYNAEKSRFGIT